MKKLSYLIVLALILGLVLTGCLLSNVGQVPATEQGGITYLTKSPGPGLVGLWHFDEESGTTAYDSSGNGNDGTVYGASWVVGKFGNALIFDAMYDYVRVFGSDSLEDLTSEITVEAWLKFNDVRNAFYVRTPFDLNKKAWGLDRINGELRFYIYDEDTPRICKKAWNPEPNVWYHIAGTYDGKDLKLYVNGAPFNSFAYIGAIDSTTQGVVMGARHSDGSSGGGSWGYHYGLIDEVRIWNVALTQDQLGKVYDFYGFFPPVDKNGLNMAKAGRAIPVKFSLNGDQGSEIFEDGYPESIKIKCDGTVTLGEIEDTVTAGGSSLSYDADADQYIYVWKTDESWAGTCRRLEVKLKDGTSYFADFKFK